MKNKLNLLLIMLILQVACLSLPLSGLTRISTPENPPVDTPTLPLPAGVTPRPTETPLSPARLFQQVELTEKNYSESGEAPVYTLETNTPVLEGNDDPRVLAFNLQAETVVAELVTGFKDGFEYLSAEPLAAGSFFQVTFLQLSPPGDILSLVFAVDGYSDGAAHPYHLTKTLNFDLESGQVLSLDALFLPGSDYLTIISNYCSTELTTRDIGFEFGFESGASPLPENYLNWNLTSEGLLITFDEYQVASYAAGMQQVTIPYTALNSLIDPQGPVQKILGY